jgi:putative intracellular protease/amidase
MKKKCLIAVSAEGYVEVASFQGSVSAYSFIQTHSLLTRAHVEVVVASLGGKVRSCFFFFFFFWVCLSRFYLKAPKFHCETDEEQAWLDSHRDALVYVDLADQSCNDFDALCVPSGVGAVIDLGIHERVGVLAAGFAAAKKPVCVLGFGVLALAKALVGARWVFEGYNVTGCSNAELARLPYFVKLAHLPEETVLDLGGLFSSSIPDEVFVVVDRSLISGQNPASTTLAVLNLIWICNATK